MKNLSLFITGTMMRLELFLVTFPLSQKTNDTIALFKDNLSFFFLLVTLSFVTLKNGSLYKSRSEAALGSSCYLEKWHFPLA
jgi:hypothetical protein